MAFPTILLVGKLPQVVFPPGEWCASRQENAGIYRQGQILARWMNKK